LALPKYFSYTKALRDKLNILKLKLKQIKEKDQKDQDLKKKLTSEFIDIKSVVNSFLKNLKFHHNSTDPPDPPHTSPLNNSHLEPHRIIKNPEFLHTLSPFCID